MTSQLAVRAASQTHIGFAKKRNEDSLYQGRWLFVIADGLGGHVAGDVASSTAIGAFKRHDRLVAPADLVTVLGRAVYEADEVLRRKIRVEPAVTGMGTTAVALLWSEDSAVIANVGDSRAYLMRAPRSPESAMTQVTEDHTYEHLVANAALVPGLPERLSRFLDGRNDGRSPDLSPLKLYSGDRVLLCSDGLSSYVDPACIRSALASTEQAATVAKRLIAAALECGGPDNVTVIVLDFLSASECGGTA